MIALSTVEAEYMAALNTTCEVIWLRILLEDLGFQQTTATILHCNTLGCITLTHSPTSQTRAKHINICHHFICERVANSEINPQFCSTKDMIVDIFTKPLACEAFENFRAMLSVGDFLLQGLPEWECQSD